MKGTINTHWRFEHGTGPEPRWLRGAVVRSCPCGGELTEADGGIGMRCSSCGAVLTYAALAAGS